MYVLLRLKFKTADYVQQRRFREILFSVPDIGRSLRGVGSVILQTQQRSIQHFFEMVQGYSPKDSGGVRGGIRLIQREGWLRQNGRDVVCRIGRYTGIHTIFRFRE